MFQVYCTDEACKHNESHVCLRSQGVMLLKTLSGLQCQQFDRKEITVSAQDQVKNSPGCGQ